MKALLTISLLLILISCNENKSNNAFEIIPFENDTIPVVDKMKMALELDYLSSIGISGNTAEYLISYYQQRNFAPKWVNDTMINNHGELIQPILKNHYQIGIPENKLATYNSANYIQDEIFITLTLSQAIDGLQNGFINFNDTTNRPTSLVQYTKLDSLSDFNYEEDLRYQFIKYGPVDTTYDVLSKGLIALYDKYPIDTNTFELESIKYDSLYAVEKARKALVSKGYLNDTISDSTQIIEGLKVFQIENGLKDDGVIGKYTSQSLNESTKHKIQRIILALDKNRSHSEFPEKYIRINIPEYKLRFFINDSLKSEHNLVVGKYENQTPELTAKLRKIVVYPFWNVPYSISSKEILPSLKRSASYLEKHNYKLFKKDEEINPYDVNWKKIRQNAFPYKVQQQPGPKNSLGIIKFDFYNTHSVYFHDTPSKGLFGADVRAYSHGCMRTQNPVDLARLILERDETKRKKNDLIADSLDSLLVLEENYEIKLIDPIPIFIEYVSVVRDGERMIIYLDIYGRDEEYIKIMNE